MNNSKEYNREWYAKNKDRIRERKLATQRNNRRKTVHALRAIKAERGCMDCGEADPIVLDFDHRDRADKSATIANMVKNNYGMTRLLKEIEKCDVVCANCHRRRTASQLGWSV